MIKRKKVLTLLSCILISSVAFSSTQAYFNSKFNLNDIMSKEVTKELSIKNGEINLSFGDKPSSWNIDGKDINAVNDVVEVSGEKDNSITTNYKYVYLDNTKTNLTTKINLAVLYGLNSNIPSYTNKVTVNNPTEPFEVMVGDIDNCNLTQLGKGYYQGFEQTVSPFSGKKYDHSASVDIYPYDNKELAYKDYPEKDKFKASTGLDKIDASGTDRKMASTGFYNTLMAVSGAKDSKDALKALTDTKKASYNPYNRTKYRLLKLESDYSGDGVDLYSGHQLWCDYYTDRSMTGTFGNDYTTDDDYKIGDKKWKYIQPVEELTFKYDKIEDNEDITSAQIYLYIDDIQSGQALETASDEFSAVSQNKYKVTLSVKDGSTWKDFEVPEWASTVNDVVLDGPSGYSMTFNLPNRLLNIIKKASGLENGLKFKIDDNSFGTTGDSYAIDFAKLTVNKNPGSLSEENGAKITGKITSDGASLTSSDLKEIRITGADGRSATINPDGSYTLITSPGVISVTVSSQSGKYSSQTKTFNKVVSEGESISWDFDLEKQPLIIDDSEKFNVNLKLEQYIKSTDTWEEVPLENPKNEDGKEISNAKSLVVNGTEVTYVSKFIQLGGNNKYRISYNVKVNSKNGIYPNASEDFYTQFWSKLIARSTQENNPGWSEDGGSIEDYISKYYNPSINPEEQKAKIYKGTVTNAKNIPADGATVLLREKNSEKIKGIYGIQKESSDFEIKALLTEGKEYEFVLKSSIHEESITKIDDINKTTGYSLTLGNEKTSQVYIEKPSNTSGNLINFDENFKLYKETSVPDVNNGNGSSHYNSNYDMPSEHEALYLSKGVLDINSNWYRWILKDRNDTENMALQIRNDINQDDPMRYTFDTKPMYWFTTNKIFICTQ